MHRDSHLLQLQTSDTIPAVDNILSKHAGVFSEGLGMIEDMQAQIQLKGNIDPSFRKPTRYC